MELKEGTPVFSARDEHVGEVDRVVLDPHTAEVVDLVVTKGIFFPEARVIPVEAISTATEERINLGDVDVDSFPPFEVNHYVPLDSAPEAYDHPLLYSGDALNVPPSLGGLPQAARTVVDRAIPEQAVALETGAGVVSSDGEFTGTVEEVLTDEDGRVTHFVVVEGALRGTRKAVPLGWVSEIGEQGVVLAVPAVTMGRLPAHRLLS